MKAVLQELWEALWAVGACHGLPGDTGSRCVLEHPHLRWPLLFLFPLADLRLAFWAWSYPLPPSVPGGKGLEVLGTFPTAQPQRLSGEIQLINIRVLVMA